MQPTKCPHCGATTNPLRPSLYFTGGQFRCSRCRKKSHFDRRPLAAFGGLGAFAGAFLQATFHFTGITLFAVALGATVALIAAIWLSLTLRPVDDQNA